MTGRPDHEFDQHGREIDALGRQPVDEATGIFGVMAWSFAVLPVAVKYRMASVQDFIVLET